jgi:hypothetical protein
MPFLSQEGKQVWDKQFHAVFVRALRKADAQHKKENRAPDPGVGAEIAWKRSYCRNCRQTHSYL